MFAFYCTCLQMYKAENFDKLRISCVPHPSFAYRYMIYSCAMHQLSFDILLFVSYLTILSYSPLQLNTCLITRLITKILDTSKTILVSTDFKEEICFSDTQLICDVLKNIRST